MDFYSDFLYARPSFLEGVARLIDFGDTLSVYNSSDAPDEIAMLRDWTIVGNNICSALEGVKKTSNKVSENG